MRIAPYFQLVKFSHSVFALPFALQGAWLARGARPPFPVLGLIVACAVAARTAAMAFNRLVDADIDARNPRTRARELPAGRLRRRDVVMLALVAAAAFVACASALNPLAGWLSLPVLVMLGSYSYFKRFSVLAHWALGVSLALAPLGAWIAVRGDFGGDLRAVLWLALAVVTWVSGFDLIYACQDAEFDREQGLYSVPARYGVSTALRWSAGLHVLTVVCLVLVGTSARLSWIYWIVLAATALLLVWEHRLVKADDLSRVDTAFFTINGWVGVGLFVGLALDRGLLAGGA